MKVQGMKRFLMGAVVLCVVGVMNLAQAAQNKSLTGQINVNTASIEQLMQLPGIGKAKADAIVKGRPYQQTADLLNVKGIGEKLLAQIKPFVVLAGVTTLTASSTSQPGAAGAGN